MATRKSTRIKPLALAYIRVSTSDQVERGASLDAQRATLLSEAERRGWDVEIAADEGLSAKNMKRPGLTSALERLDAGEADFLLAVRLDRVSRSVADFAGMQDRAARKGWGIVVLGSNIDTSDPASRFTGNILAAAAQYERELIGARTREGMAEKKRQAIESGIPTNFGRPRTMSLEIVREIKTAHASGMSMLAIANSLTERGVPTAQSGARWYASTIKKVLQSA